MICYNRIMVKVMVFGIFDGPHKNHREVLEEAKTYGQHLIAVVAQDHVAQHSRGHLPKLELADRIAAVQKIDAVDEVATGDMVMGTWEVVKKYRPDVIVCGYDQQDLKAGLERNLALIGYKPRIVILKTLEVEARSC